MDKKYKGKSVDKTFKYENEICYQDSLRFFRFDVGGFCYSVPSTLLNNANTETKKNADIRRVELFWPVNSMFVRVYFYFTLNADGEEQRVPIGYHFWSSADGSMYVFLVNSYKHQNDKLSFKTRFEEVRKFERRDGSDDFSDGNSGATGTLVNYVSGPIVELPLVLMPRILYKHGKLIDGQFGD